MRTKQFTCAGSIVDQVMNHPKIEVKFQTKVLEVGGEQTLQYIVTEEGEQKERHRYEGEHGENIGVFVFAGYEPATALFKEMVELNEQADGAIAATSMEKYLFSLYENLGIKKEEKPNRTTIPMEQEMEQQEEETAFLSEAMKQELYPIFERFTKNVMVKVYLDSSDLSKEVKDTLDALRNRGMKLAIGSSSKNAKFILGQLGLFDYFDAISDGNNITKSKPDPEVFLKAAEYMKKSPEKCIVVEDAKAGLEAGIAGGFACAAIGDATKSGLANWNLNTFSDLLNI